MNRFSTLVLAVLMLLPAANVVAQVPQTMSYQGVLTDGAGNLVPDGFYDVTFRIYDAPVAGGLLWTEARTGANHVSVVKGGFSVNLGGLVPLTLAFDGPLYLGIQLGADPELVPRVALASSPYAMGLRLPFTLSSPAGTGLLYGSDYGGFGAALEAFSSGGSGYTWALEPDVNGSGGYFWVNRAGGANGFVIDGNVSPAGDPFVSILGTAREILFDVSQPGDASVTLPTSAVSAGEILDEPGVAQGHINGSVTIPVGGTMGDLVTVTITTPAPGYIVLEADGQHGIGGSATVTQNHAALQIDETAGGGQDFNHYFYSGYFCPAGGHNFFSYSPVSLRRTYFKAAGTYTFRIEGFATQSEALSNYLFNPTITATFYPTSYGGVVTSPAAVETGQFSDVKTTVSAGNGPGAAPVQGQLVDLRELELRAAKATAEAEHAERALVEARMAEQAKARTARGGTVPAPVKGD